MHKERTKIWIEALRSDKYWQGKGVLKSTDGKRHCCLGVACELSNLGNWITAYIPTYIESPPENRFLPIEVITYYDIDHDTEAYLAMKNDNGESFDEIATYLETLLDS